MFLEFLQTEVRVGTEEWTLPSAILARDVTCVIYRSEIDAAPEPLHLLLINDGQDLATMQYDQILASLYQKKQIYPVLTVGIKAGNRLEEFGISGKADYKGRGAQADSYRRFITEELLPALHQNYNKAEFVSYAVAGFSLGALSAFDIAWHHADIFARVGAFSGSFWWRSKETTARNPDKYRLAHKLIRSTSQVPALQFWLQAGTQDEDSDRNQNGIIDSIDEVIQSEPSGYDVIVDRISQDVPFYRAMLKNAAMSGTAVINNPFWWSADEKFFNNALAIKIGVPVPKTVLLPSRDMPDSTTGNSFRNLEYPLDWEGIFNYVGFPAYMKPFDGGGWRDVYKLHDPEDFFDKFNQTRQLVMMLQEEIIFDDYFRCYCVGGEHVRIMQYEPRNPHHLRYEHGKAPAAQAILDQVTDYVLRLNRYLGYDLNTVEFAIRDGVPYAIDFCNPAPDADLTSVGEENFEWIVETMATYAINRATQHQPGQDNLTWGQFVRSGSAKTPLVDESLNPAASAKTSRKTKAGL